MNYVQLKLKNWSYRKHGESQWTKGRQTETTEIFADLLANKTIPDPFIDDDEKKVQWVGEEDWDYQVTFDVEESTKTSFNTHRLVFEGLDTFTTIYLNGDEILTTDNMFREYSTNVSNHLVVGTNVLEIQFKSALIKGRELEKKYGKKSCWNGESSRVYVRKAQYHYGWDWGPVLISAGPYKPIRFEAFNSFIDDVYVKVDVNEELVANIDVQTTIINGDGDILIEVTSPDGEVVFSDHEKATNDVVSKKISLENPSLWYPVGCGKPDLYEIKVTLKDQVVIKKVGLRRLELIQEKLIDQPGTSFYFRVNNIPVYINGSNWIPDHSILTHLTENTYETSLKLMINGNQNMIRVWGGGIYEYDIFYDLCDKFGLLVWQDFMFACGIYPGFLDFIDNVTEEARTQVKRLRNHCCMAIYTGNNEDYQIAEQLQIDFKNYSIFDDYTKENFPARLFYEDIFPKSVAKYSPEIPYHFGSPYGGTDTTDQTVGDIHQWNVWHGDQRKYQDWYKLGGRFVSEFGMLAFPDFKTYQDCITDETEMYPQSRLIDHHNRSDGFERRLALYVTENIKITNYDLKSWIYATQLMQAECLGYAYRCWRREWKGEGRRYLGGAIVWQINDCWPVASWAIVDFYNRPKLAYYSVKRESAPLSIGLYRNEITEKKQANNEFGLGAEHDLTDKQYTIDIWGVNSNIKSESGVLKIDIYNIISGEIIQSIEKPVILNENSSTPFETGLPIDNAKDVVIHARLLQNNQEIVSAADWPQPLKYLKFPDREVKIQVEDDRIKLTSNKPVKGVDIKLENDIFLQDNGFDLFPTQNKIVTAEGLRSKDHVTVTYYQQQ